MNINKYCWDCGVLMSIHCEPFSNKPTRTCSQAIMYDMCPDHMFCRKPERCSMTKRCYSQDAYGKACND